MYVKLTIINILIVSRPQPFDTAYIFDMRALAKSMSCLPSGPFDKAHSASQHIVVQPRGSFACPIRIVAVHDDLTKPQSVRFEGEKQPADEQRKGCNISPEM